MPSDSHPSHPTGEAPPGSSRRPLTLEELEARVRILERSREEHDSGEGEVAAAVAELKETVASIRATQKEHSVQLAKVVEAVGESPDEATETQGKGMRKTLADLVRKSKAPTISAHVAAVGTVAIAAYQVLKLAGVLK